jgi:ketosteroid isomerase-like protein
MNNQHTSLMKLGLLALVVAVVLAAAVTLNGCVPAPTVAEQNKAVIRRQLEAFGPGKLSVLEQLADELYTADYVVHDPGSPGLPRGPEGVKVFVRGFLTAIPDARITVEDQIAEGDKVTTRFTMRGTNAASGKPVTMQVLCLSRFVGGKIAEEWQIGVPVEAQP